MATGMSRPPLDRGLTSQSAFLGTNISGEEFEDLHEQREPVGKAPDFYDQNPSSDGFGLCQFRLRVRDDGKGMDPQVLEKGGRAGHWGLPGVRERAQQMGAKLDIWGEAGTGTEVQLTVAAAIAYEKTPDRSGFRLFRWTRKS